MTDNLKRLQEREIDILKQTLAIIQRHKLKYYMLGGTLLGAVRHQGMIPWDDDIDIGLPRPDYEVFLKAAETELFAPYQLHTLHTNPGEYSYYYARVENMHMKVVRRAALKTVEIPVWIDVFPLDGVPNDERKAKRWLKRSFFWQRLFKYSQYSYYGAARERVVKRNPLKNIARNLFIATGMERLLNTQRMWKRLDRALKSSRYEDCDRLINLCGFWGIKELFPKSYYGEGRLYPFEDMMLNGPVDYDAVLTQMYGDYMTPPPAEKREHHFIELID